MCNPIAAAGFGLQAIGQVANYQAEKNAYAENDMEARLAAQRAYEDEGKKFIYNTKTNMQEGYDAAMKGKQAVGTAIASAGSAGVDASSLSVGSLLSEENRKTAFNLSNVDMKQDDLRDSYDSTATSISSQAKARINSATKPNALALGLNIASTGLNSYTNYKK